MVRLLMLEKPKLSFDIGSITIKANIGLSEKETGKYLRTFSRSLLSGSLIIFGRFIFKILGQALLL